MPLQPGVILHNRYRIVKSLGQGGFGAMYRAWDMTLDRQCAIKENLDASPEARRQFLREAKILANLTHPNLPRVTDYFFIQIQGQYLVMDYVEGQDLQEMLDDRGSPLPEDKILPWIEQVCDALDYLHAQNPAIIHRDIKPANVKITPGGRAILVDFGIAKIYDPTLKTTVGAQAVTPGFSPVEQYGKGITDARSDLYALGATLYVLLTGEEPPESVGRVVKDPLTPPRKLNPAISHRTEAALLRILQIDPDQRFQRAADFKAAIHMPKPAAPPVSGAAPPTQRATPWRWIGAASLAALAIIAIIATVVPRGGTWRRQPSGSEAAAGALLQLSETPPPATKTPVPATLTPTNTPPPSPTPLVYIVQAGDTCSQIAYTYGVSLDSIINLNDLPDCEVLFAGQRLLIPALAPLGPESGTASSSPTPPQPVATRLAKSDGMLLVYVPAGNFLMGASASDSGASDDETPQREVYLDAFWIDLTEVTNRMYALCVGTGACDPPQESSSQTHSVYYGDERFVDYPVLYVSWQDAQAYCKWAGRRLPSEAEWEKAARGTDGRLYPWPEPYSSPRLANFNNQVGDTTPVGYYPLGASPYAALDMAGNVAEWVADWYSEDTYADAPDRNPLGPDSGVYRVLRGGSWLSMPHAVRVTSRLWNYPDLHFEGGGFRCAQSD